MTKPLSICVVDDDKIYKFTVKKSLENIDVVGDTTMFSDGEEVLEFITNNISNEEHLPDVILLDINMPVMDGFQFLEEFVKVKPKLTKKIIVYMVSSSVDPCDIEKSKQISVVADYLIKPIKPEELKEVLVNVSKL